MLLSAVACSTVARRVSLAALSCLLLAALYLSSAAAVAATPVTPQQLTVTAANASGDSIYDLSLATGASGALISGIQALNSDGGKHGSFDALVWSPNAFTGTLDLIVADATKGQILRYAGPNYGTSSVVFSYSGKGSGPAYPTGLSADGAGNLYAISPSAPINATPALWVLPFNKTTGAYGAPVLIDDSFGGVRTLALAEVLVAGTAATPDGNAAPAWNIGDLLVLVGDTFDSRVIVYSQASIQRVLANPKVPLSGPTATIVSSKQFLSLIAAPFGMDIWPADSTHGVSLLFTTIDGRIIRFDTKQNAFTGNFASGLGLLLQKVKVGSYAGKPYAFVAQLGLGSNGQILQFGAPPASGNNKPVASITKGVSEPIGLALTSSGSTPVSSCIAPNTCSPLGPQFTIQISGPGASRIPAGATILQQACTVTDPRVQVTGGVWSCLPPSMNVCGATPTPGCVAPTLNVANFCPGFPSTILPATMCGHAGTNGSSLQVIKETAELLDENANDIYIQNAADPTIALPGAYDLGCQQGVGRPFGPVVAFAPRSDLPTIEGTIVEDALAPYFDDITGYCDTGGGNSHVASMFAFGLGLNTGANGTGSGANAGLFGFVTTKFNNLSTMIQEASPQITPQTVTTTLENYVTQSQTYFNSDYQHDVNDYSCALNSIASADFYLRNQANGTAFRYVAPAGGNNNPNPAGEIDSRLANLYYSISGDFLYAPNPTWPTTNVPPCVQLAIAETNNTPAAVGGSATLNFGPPTPQFASTPLLYSPMQCILSATDGTYTTAKALTSTSGSVSTGTLTKPGTYTATLECTGASNDISSSFATASVVVSSQPPPPTLISISVTPQGATLAAGQTIQYSATGSYSSGSIQSLTNSVTWSTPNNGIATVSNAGVLTCRGVGPTSVAATSGTIVGAVGLSCTAGPTTSITVTPATPTVTAGNTQQFTAAGVDQFGNQTVLNPLSWSSSNPQIVINASSGSVTCTLDGTSTITATSGGASGSTLLTCQPGPLTSLTLPAAESSVLGGTYQYFPIGMDAYGNVVGPGALTWASTNTAVAAVNGGLVSCLSQGTATITATSGNIVSNGSAFNCGAALTLSANPVTTPINTNATLTWASAPQLAGDSCTLTSNSSDKPLALSGQSANGSYTDTEAVSQNVTYTISCSGAVSATATASVLYTLVTTYQYTGNQFNSFDAFHGYTSADRVIASITVSVPFGANANINGLGTTGSAPGWPGFVLTMSDGLQTLGPATLIGWELTTDANGNINTWSMTNSITNADGSSNAISTQSEPVAGEGSVDDGYINLPAGASPCDPSQECGITNAPGTWTSSNVQNLQVIVGTTSGTSPSTGQLYQVIGGGSPALSAATILSEAPEPASCFGGSGVSGVAAAVTGLAWVPNASSGYQDLVAANANAGDVFRLSGPSYQPTSDINDSSANCWNTGPAGVSVAANAGGDMLGAGHGVASATIPSLYYFPPNPSTSVPNFVLMDNVNADQSLTSTCNSGAGPGCVATLVDTVIAPIAVSGPTVAAGDMLVLVGDAYAGNSNPVVLRFSAANIQAAKACAAGNTTPCTSTGGSQLIKQGLTGAPAQGSTLNLQSGESPVSMDISPADGSLFIATSLGNIYQLPPNSTGYGSQILYASGQSGIKQIRVGVHQQSLYVFATVQNGGANSVAEFGGPAPSLPLTAPVASATVGGTPVGLSVH